MTLGTILMALGVAFAITPNPATLSGPITGGERGSPFAAVDVADRGYLTEEYFVEGEATAYELIDGTHGVDGQWRTRASADKADYRTRMLVVRPKDPSAFNGTVIVFWLNVTAGFDLGSAGGEALRGYAWVGVSAQKVGIDGFAQNPQGLKAWDPKRYGSLVHPGDAYSYDIFTQVAGAIGPERDRQDLDPMGGLKVERLIAAGASQSAARLRTYINGVHPLAGVFDGFLPFIDFGAIVPFASAPSGARRGRSLASIRADLDVPVSRCQFGNRVDQLLRRTRAGLGPVPALGGAGDFARIRGETGGTHRRRRQLAVLLPGIRRRDQTSAPVDQGRCRTTENASSRAQSRRSPSRSRPGRTRQRRRRHSAAGA